MKIELIGVSKSFKERELFSDLNAVFNPGEITCILGNSGCGKTTLLNMIGLIESYDGQILYDGYAPKGNKNTNKFMSEKIGFIFQNFALLENETVIDNFKVLKKFKNNSKEKEKISKILKTVGLTGIENKKVYLLSGGEQQRVAIAKILYKNPDIILADEPTASLDEDNKKGIIELLISLKKMNKTVVVVTHDQFFKNISDKTIYV